MSVIPLLVFRCLLTASSASEALSYLVDAFIFGLFSNQSYGFRRGSAIGQSIPSGQ
jgi:hypothetical protein